MGEPISFGALVGLMVCGAGEPDTVRGEVRSVDRDGAEQRRRVARHGPLVREENADGTLRRIVGEHASWLGRGAGPPVRREHEPAARFAMAGSPIGGLEVGGERPSWSRWDGTDFTRPTGPVRAAQLLGRAAYAVELAPPGHKPAPIQLVVDAASGRVLRVANAAFGRVEEWTEVQTGVPLPAALFRWDGPSVDEPTRGERDAAHDREQAERQAWLDARGLAALPVPVEPQLQLHVGDDAGRFVASLEFAGSGALARRPRADGPWPAADELNYRHTYRWSDGRWDWCLALEQSVSPEQLAVLRVRLATTT